MKKTDKRESRFIAKTPMDKSFWLFVILAVASGLAAGIFGAVLTRTYIWGEIFPDGLTAFNLNPTSGGLIVRDPKNITVSADVQISETLESLKPVLVGIFRALPENDEQAYYRLDSPLFVGLIMTADGWVIAPADIEASEPLLAPDNLADYVAIASDRRVYKIEQVVSPADAPEDLLLFRLTGAANLPVKNILTRSELKPGQALLVLKSPHAVWPTNLTSASEPSAVLNSDISRLSLGLAGLEDQSWENSFVFDLAGNLLALINASGEIRPAFSDLPRLSAAIQKRAWPGVFLGVNYLDLSMVKVPAINLDKGALLYKSDSRPAIALGSPAEAAGLVAGDIITWVGNKELGAGLSLSDALSLQSVGDKVVLSYLRDGLEKNTEVVLGAVNSAVEAD